MKANNFRIGNFVTVSGKCELISIVSIARVWFQPKFMGKAWTRRLVSDIIPIKLSEETLLKCGFKNDNDEEYFYLEINSSNVTISINPNFTGIAFFDSEDIQTNRFYIELKYLHQLQNLYFSLTSQELEINL